MADDDEEDDEDQVGSGQGRSIRSFVRIGLIWWEKLCWRMTYVRTYIVFAAMALQFGQVAEKAFVIYFSRERGKCVTSS